MNRNKHSYDPKKIEAKWQKVWEKKGIYKTSNNSQKKTFYGLIEFPYPSGAGLHVGHIRSNTAMDIVARKRRAQGYNVLYPIGWDAFGLPTENYAIKTGIHPIKVTKQNTDMFRKQLKAVGFSFDWSREVNTTDPAYYKWTQWIFLKMYKKGLAYKDTIAINWCPKDKIGLANEEVVNGCCERCGTPVERRNKEQWMLAITKYADRLHNDLDTVDYIPEVIAQQRNWIGKSEGAEFDFAIADSDKKITVFTTRADTLYGVTYVVLAPEHPLIETLKSRIKNWDAVSAYITKARAKTEIERTAEDKEKTGIALEGVYTINPANNEKVPVYIADYVLAQYGTGAVMAVPAHDARDYAFAQKYHLPIKEVVQPLVQQTHGSDAIRADLPFVERKAAVCIVKHWADDTYLCLKWKKNDWQGFVVGGIEGSENPEDAGMREITEETGYKNPRFVKKLGTEVHAQFYHELKNQNRFGHFQGLYFELENGERNEISAEEQAIHEIKWLTPKEVAAFVNVDDMMIIWKRSQGDAGAYTDDGLVVNSGEISGKTSAEARSHIAKRFGKARTTFKLRDWVFSRQRYWGEPIPMIHCEHCGWQPVPEKDLPVTLPKVARYEPTDNGESPLALMESWVKTKCPVCKGPARRETDTMPNWAGSSWYYLRYVDPKNKKVFADKNVLRKWTPVDWYNGGMEHTTLHLLYSRFWHKFLYDLKLVPTKEPYKKRTSHGMILAEGGEKMSKSKGNVINPDDVIKTWGADTLRLYEMFIGPFNQAVAWSTDSIIGSRRFIEKLWRLKDKIIPTKKSGVKARGATSLLNGEQVKGQHYIAHELLKKVGEDIERMAFNTAVSAMMIAVNELDGEPEINQEAYEIVLKTVAPFIPHVAEELWGALGYKKSIHTESWPKYKKITLKKAHITLPVQVNGKLRSELICEPDLAEETIKKQALIQVEQYIQGQEVVKVIYIPGRIINIVVKPKI